MSELCKISSMQLNAISRLQKFMGEEQKEALSFQISIITPQKISLAFLFI